MSAPLSGTAPGAWSRRRAPRTVLAPSSVTIEDAHLQHICQVFYQVRGELERGDFPARAVSLRTVSALCPPLLAPALQEATPQANGLAWWHELWYSLSVA